MSNINKEKKDIEKSTKEFEKKSFEKMILMNQLKLTKSTYNNSIAHTTLGSKISLTPKLEANKLKSRSEAQWKSSSLDGSKGSNRLIQPQVLFKQDESFLGNTYYVSVYRKKGKHLSNFGHALVGNDLYKDIHLLRSDVEELSFNNVDHFGIDIELVFENRTPNHLTVFHILSDRTRK
jgi:hypothetical protein